MPLVELYQCGDCMEKSNIIWHWFIIRRYLLLGYQICLCGAGKSKIFSFMGIFTAALWCSLWSRKPAWSEEQSAHQKMKYMNQHTSLPLINWYIKYSNQRNFYLPMPGTDIMCIHIILDVCGTEYQGFINRIVTETVVSEVSCADLAMQLEME